MDRGSQSQLHLGDRQYAALTSGSLLPKHQHQNALDFVSTVRLPHIVSAGIDMIPKPCKRRRTEEELEECEAGTRMFSGRESNKTQLLNEKFGVGEHVEQVRSYKRRRFDEDGTNSSSRPSISDLQMRNGSRQLEGMEVRTNDHDLQRTQQHLILVSSPSQSQHENRPFHGSSIARANSSLDFHFQSRMESLLSTCNNLFNPLSFFMDIESESSGYEHSAAETEQMDFST